MSLTTICTFLNFGVGVAEPNGGEIKFFRLSFEGAIKSLLKLVYLFQNKSNFSIVNIFFGIVSWHQKYIDL